MRIPPVIPLVAALALILSACGTTEGLDDCNSDTACDPVDGGRAFDADPQAPDASIDGSTLSLCEGEDAPDCSDGVGCTVDSCDDESEECTHLANHDNCADPTPFCHPSLGCVDQTCDGPEDCDDGTFCNGEEVCDIPKGATVGTCRSGTPPSCADSVTCTTDTCNVATDSCANAPDNSVCDDGLFCNGAELCDAALDCQAGTAPAAGDGVGCTVDTCNESTDSFDHTPVDAACADGKFCNGDETCHVTLDCQDGVPPFLGDGVGCTIDSCNETLDVIQHIADHSVCDDGKFCNGDEVCHVTLDCQSGTPPIVNDGIGCTVDGCDEVTDTIIHQPDDAACVDSFFCNGIEACSPTVDCVAGTPVDCTPHPICDVSNMCSEALEDCLRVPAQVGYRWSLSGSGGASGLSQKCGETDVVFSNPDACDATHGFDFRCSFDADGKLGAFVAGTGGFTLGCFGIAGSMVESGCSSVTIFVPELDASQVFSCCHE